MGRSGHLQDPLSPGWGGVGRVMINHKPVFTDEVPARHGFLGAGFVSSWSFKNRSSFNPESLVAALCPARRKTVAVTHSWSTSK